MVSPPDCPAAALERRALSPEQQEKWQAQQPAAMPAAPQTAVPPAEPMSDAEKACVLNLLDATPPKGLHWSQWDRRDLLYYLGYVRARKEEPEPGISGLRFVCVYTSHHDGIVWCEAAHLLT